jgi:hypothetical protein
VGIARAYLCPWPSPWPNPPSPPPVARMSNIIRFLKKSQFNRTFEKYVPPLWIYKLNEITNQNWTEHLRNTFRHFELTSIKGAQAWDFRRRFFCIYEVCLLNTRKTQIFSFTLSGQLFSQNMFYSALCFEKLLFQSFLPIFHVIGGRRSAILLSLLTPSHSLL